MVNAVLAMYVVHFNDITACCDTTCASIEPWHVCLFDVLMMVALILWCNMCIFLLNMNIYLFICLLILRLLYCRSRRRLNDLQTPSNILLMSPVSSMV